MVHPGAANMMEAVVDLLNIQLDAVTSAGAGLLKRKPHPPVRRMAGIMARRRLRAATAWRVSRLTVPSPLPAVTRPPTDAPDVRSRPSKGDTARFTRPPAHPVGPPPHALLAGPVPAHVAVVMDGNGRWAIQRRLPRPEGHRVGRNVTYEIVHGALELGVRHLTLYAFSTGNWRRDPEEVQTIFELFLDGLCARPFEDLDVRLRWAGTPGELAGELVEEMRHQETVTRDRTGLTLTYCVNYGGREEITRAAAALAATVRTDGRDVSTLTQADLSRFLIRPDMPDVDLLWRPGAEQRISDFLLWQSAYAELHFTTKLWPDVDRRDLWAALETYQQRRRRFGATTEELSR
ncbi:polyprenyl diphosphate synthase [Streptomyces sp. NPDC127068]|uniref:polyprenyl diphosphate synthase n=1 Tax=Streptomyces sp. NPDC127068 TaxID=3347127 RepID=UPI0036618236